MMEFELALTFYYAPGACSLASHIALIESDLTFEAIPVALAKGEQQQPRFLALNPKGRIPLLMTDFGPLTENPAILEYVADLAPEVALKPVGCPDLLAKLRELNAYLSSTVHVAHAHGPRGYRWASSAEALLDMKAKVPETMLAAFEYLEQQLAAFAGPWCLGEVYSVADMYLYTFSRWLEMDKVDTQKLPRVLAHRAQMESREAVKTVLLREGIPAMGGNSMADATPKTDR